MNTSDNEDGYPDYSWNDQDPEEIQDLLLRGGPDEDLIERALDEDTCQICKQEVEHDDEHVCQCKCEAEWRDSDEFCLDCGHRFDCFIADEDSFECTGHHEHKKMNLQADVEASRELRKHDLFFASTGVKALIVELARIREQEKDLRLESEKVRKQILAEVLTDTDRIYDSVDGALLAWLETKEGLRFKPGCRQALERGHPEIVDEFFEAYSTTYLKLRRNLSD